MKNKSLNAAAFSLFYVLGLCALFLNLKLIFALLALLLLTIGILADKIKPLFGILLYLLFFFGIFNASIHNKSYDSLSAVEFANNVSVKGRVISIPKTYKNGETLKFFLNSYSVELYGEKYKTKDTKLLISLNNDRKEYKDFRIGDVIEIKGKLRTPGEASNPSQFSYKNYLKHKGVFSIIYAEANDYNIICHPDIQEANNKLKEAWWALLQALDKTRDNIMISHGKYIKSPNLEVLGGIVFGDEAVNPPDSVKQTFINSGLLHLLAASGLNVALIFAMWWAVANFINLPYKTNIITGAGIVVLYSFMTGFPPSIARASVMLLFILAGKLFFKSADSVALIFFTGFIILVFSPNLLFDIGFQLSFLVTAGLITCIEPIAEKLRKQDNKFKSKYGKLPGWAKIFVFSFSPISLFSVILVPFIAQLWASPLQMYYFNTFSPYSVFANIAVVPFIGIISFLGFLSSMLITVLNTFFFFIPLLEDFFTRIFDLVLNPFISLLLIVSNYFSSMPESIIKMPSPSVYQIILFYILILLLVRNLKYNFKKQKLPVYLFIITVMLVSSFVKIDSKNFELTAFDVGNADNFLIKSPDSKYFMIDTGKIPYKGISSAKRITLEHLYDKNIKELQTVIVTHFDSDHSGGTIDILENIKVNKLIIQSKKCNSQNSCNIIKYIESHPVNYEFSRNNKVIYSKKDFKITTFQANIRKLKDTDKIENENSIITLVENKNFKILLMADAGNEAFNKIKYFLPENIDILKVGHHGAKNVVSKEMLDYLKPKYSIVSTGFNVYGHPDSETISLLEESGTKILSTKHYGAIKIIFNDKNMEIFTYKNQENINDFKKFKEMFFNSNPYAKFDTETKDYENENLLNGKFAKNLLKYAS